MKRLFLSITGLLVVGGLVGCSSGAMSTKTQLGAAKDTVGDQTEVQLVKCAQPLGTAALVEATMPGQAQGAQTAPGLDQVGLPSPVPLLRLMMNRSNCFQVVDRGQASEIMRRERELMAAGQLQEGSGPGAGQMVAAEYLITPNVIFQDAKASGGGVGAALVGLAGWFVPGAAAVGAVAGSVKIDNLEAQTVLTLTNVRTGLQESVSEGSARKRDIGFGVLGVGAGAPRAALALGPPGVGALI